MLVLTRRAGEEIIIAGNITITVAGLQGDRVRLGITAPRSVAVDRKEVYERRQAFAEFDPPQNGYQFFEDVPLTKSDPVVHCMASR
jgi:carbon storage regulator